MVTTSGYPLPRRVSAELGPHHRRGQCRGVYIGYLEIMMNQQVYKVVEYNQWKDLKRLREIVLQVEGISRLHQRDAIVPIKKSIGWFYLAMRCHIRGRTDAVTKFHQTIKMYFVGGFPSATCR
ncbi:unnamed protein product [Clonostachys solani]|uniref:Uncharacterized protein n=1 Tax=Clonostachys solani TaxID=160281 RepID=A0A9N9W9U9_9HYPO|nr:unnamed protein product [Clonostachys solani]